MYKRYLNNGDYIGLLTEDHLDQLIRGDERRLAEAEEAAEISMLEYLTESYEIEKVLQAGKNIFAYNPQVTYPAGTFFYFSDKIVKALRTINGCKRPSTYDFWAEYDGLIPEGTPAFSQLGTYGPGDLVSFANTFYVCVGYNGADFSNIRVPGVMGWEAVKHTLWMPNYEYDLWEVVEFNKQFYTIMTREGLDLTENPEISDCWGLIGDYTEDYEYDFVWYEYVVYNGEVFSPIMNVNADAVHEGVNVKAEDPRHSNVKKHLLRLAVYELFKLISPNNVSKMRMLDYETSMQWLRDAARMRINPQLPRRVDENNDPVCEWQLGSFSASYDPNGNMWHI